MNNVQLKVPTFPFTRWSHCFCYGSEAAESYKEDGNNNFKLKKYRWAIDSYTEGIKKKCSDRLLNAQLYTNRAAANYFIGELKRLSVSFSIEEGQL